MIGKTEDGTVVEVEENETLAAGFETVTAVVTEGDDGSEKTSISLDYDFGVDLEAMISKWGAEQVYECAKKQARVMLQGVMRRCYTNGQEIASLADEWAPGVQMKREVDPVKLVRNKLGDLSPEQIAEMQAMLEAMA